MTYSKKKRLYVCPDCLREYTIEKKMAKRRLFLSYGHDEYTSLAENLKKDMQTQGHEVWFDLDRLKPGGCGKPRFGMELGFNVHTPSIRGGDQNPQLRNEPERFRNRKF